MLRLCFCHKNNLWELNQWGYLLATFLVDEVYVIGTDPDIVRDAGILKKATFIKTAEDLPEAALVVAAPKDGKFVQGDTPLSGFKHPEDATYLFGLDNKHLSEKQLGKREPDYKVYIAAESHYEFFAHVAAGIFLYDRKVKS